MHHRPHPDHDRGLQFDVTTLLRRRRMLGLLAGASLATITGCTPGTPGAAPSSTSPSPTSAPPRSIPATSAPGTSAPPATADCTAEIPRETAGPFPGDGSNGPDALTQSGIVRSDIRAGFGGASGGADGAPLTINLAVLDLTNGCSAYAGAAVYVWHCDIAGRYSMYSDGVTGENYLRGVQQADERGNVSFTSVFPAAYAGRWPHVHFEVYPDLDAATSASNKIVTSQLALPEEACAAVYATSGYEASLRNLARTSLTSDTVFRDGTAQQLATVTGDVTTGLTATLAVPVRT
jgi:protocatechuate 3,4-dioxygenase beta subunit